jgi:FkbH-like protein
MTMFEELPWLARPAAADRDALAKPIGSDSIAEIERLRGIADRYWNEAELRSLGRKVRTALSDQNAGWRDDARRSGLLPFYLLIISSRTVSHLTDALRATALRSGILLRIRVAEYEEPESWLEENGQSLRQDTPEAALLAIDRKTLNLFTQVGNADAAADAVEASIDRLQGMVAHLIQVTGRPVIVENLASEPSDPQASTDAWLPGAPRRLIAAFNERLAAGARDGAYRILDTAVMADLVGQGHWSAGRYWFVAKLPFAPTCIPLYAHRLLQLIAAMAGKSKRILVLDLDNTLWGGVIGDDGLGGIVLGAGSALGEAHLAIQRMARRYKDRGVILCIASKNSEETAREVFCRHPEMLLKESDVALFQVNWSDKASNIKSMAEALDLGLDTVVFVDDNPVERKQVRDVLPLVTVPELPADPATWVPALEAAAFFELLSFTPEDRARTEYYKGNAQRAMRAQTIGDHRKFLESLAMVMTVAPFDSIGRGRIVQLLAKSNQFNLTTRRYSETEVAGYEADSGAETLQIRLADMFGDNGMIAVIICLKQPVAWEIDTWVMSCRVLGRGVEQASLALLAERARAAGALELRGSYIPTPKNALVRDHYAKLGFAQTAELDNGHTAWKLSLADFTPSTTPIKIVETSR